LHAQIEVNKKSNVLCTASVISRERRLAKDSRVISGLLPFALRAALRAFKSDTFEFAAGMTFRKCNNNAYNVIPAKAVVLYLCVQNIFEAVIRSETDSG
jgi:hypothetical protein